MEIIKYYHHRGHINEVANRYHAFSVLNEAKIKDVHNLQWRDADSGYISHHAQIAFFGKTGYGKSTTVNSFFGRSILRTSSVSACTRNCDSLNFELSKDSYLSFADFPGIGESEYRDKEYLEMYSNFLGMSTIVVYVLRADTRDYEVDKSAYQSIFKTNPDRKKVIFALNFCDKIEPINRSHSLIPNPEQMHNINKKINIVNGIFNPINNIIPYSAETGWNMNILSGKITELILKSGVIE